MRGIADLIDSDMENAAGFIDENSILSSAADVSDADQQSETNRTKNTKKRHRVTMPKSKTRVTKPVNEARVKKTTKKANTTKRKALEEKVNGTSGDTDLVESVETEITQAKKPGKPKSQAIRPSSPEDEREGLEIDQTPLATRSNFAQTKKGAPKVTARPAAPKVHKAIQKSKPTSANMEVERADPVEVSELAPLPQPRPRARIRDESTVRRRAGSASDTERVDPNLRRRLGDMTRKFENVDLKYHNLREVGIHEANANVDKLRRQCEATTHASNELIVSLKKELAAHLPATSECRKLKKELLSRETELSELKARDAEVSSSLSAAQNEIKALQAKLAASRSASVAAEPLTSKTPGNVTKGPPTSRTVMVGSTEAAQAAQVAQMKEDLYSDLTGLIIRGVRRTDKGDTFDCIQTGRNGSKCTH